MMISTPTISVVMPAFNAAQFLDEAVCSILDQTFRDFEFIIVDDGSTDDTAQILQKYAKADSRVRVFPQANEGMIGALNRGCRLSRGEYIARMDADDISLPHRIERQITYLERHPEIGILGTWASRINENGSVVGDWCLSPNPKVLKWSHFFYVCVIHPTVLMRREVLEKLDFYRVDAVHAEDRDLWLRANSLTQFSNVPEILLNYRVWPGGTSRHLRQEYRETQSNVLALFISQFLKSDVSIEAVNRLQGRNLESLGDIRSTAALLEKLYDTFLFENALSSEEHKEISWLTAKKLGNLALRALRFSRLEFLSLFNRALQLDYRLLSPSAIRTGLERIAHGISQNESVYRLHVDDRYP
jgi:glycosyltransferase involved in cell wall biosynthesis